VSNSNTPKTATNTGISYEKLVTTIYENLLQQEDVENLEIKHNAHIQGRTSAHQIDVYWRFKIGGVEYKTVVQCKDWKNKVSQTEVQAFDRILKDISGQPRGIMITRTGYQAGAKRWAEAEGIILYTLREPITDEDWHGIVRKIIVDFTFSFPHGDKAVIEVDQAWLQTEKVKCGMQYTRHFFEMWGMYRHMADMQAHMPYVLRLNMADDNKELARMLFGAVPGDTTTWASFYVPMLCRREYRNGVGREGREGACNRLLSLDDVGGVTDEAQNNVVRL